MQFGLYEQLLTEMMKNRLTQIDGQQNEISLVDIEHHDINYLLGRYIQGILTYYLNQVKSHSDQPLEDNSGSEVEAQEHKTNLLKIQICNDIIHTLQNINPQIPLDDFIIHKPGQILKSIYPKAVLSNLEKIFLKNEIGPNLPLSINTLFIGSSYNEPQLMSELKKEICTTDTIDFLVSFIRWSGLLVILEELKTFTNNPNNRLRILTTTYMGATQAKAIRTLASLPNTEVKISYDINRTRLHAKAYIFNRKTHFGSAYIGSSNLSYSAISTGLEWNVKIAEQDSRDIFEKAKATFEVYWNEKEFEFYSPSDPECDLKLTDALWRANIQKTGKSLSDLQYTKSRKIQFQFTIQPHAFQKEILDKLNIERLLHQRFHNLIVAATGTGKTIISAFDFKRFFEETNNPSKRLLFVAHRKEILEQSIDCFRRVLKDENFGDIWVDKYFPKRENPDHLFLSIQTFNSKALEKIFPESYFDFIIIDEFHHGAADSYQKLLHHFRPRILLGLTATPERMDGKSIVDMYFDGIIAAEIRLPEAINQKLLSPFHYFMVTDPISLKNIKWVNGHYDEAELEKLYTETNDSKANSRRMEVIFSAVERYLGEIDNVKGIGFCVGRRHVQYMAKLFSDYGIPSIGLDSNSPDLVRDTAKNDLQTGKVKFIFVADLYNEGVDIPDANTILFLRPTESLTIFLQQLGRGLRLHENKECLTVLDFVAHASQQYNFVDKFRALLGKSKKSLDKQIEENFPDLPKGCYITLEHQAREYVLENIRQATIDLRYLTRKLNTFNQVCSLPLTMVNFLRYYRLEISDLYKVSPNAQGWNRLLVKARLQREIETSNPNASVLLKGIQRLTVMNSAKFLMYFHNVFLEPIQFDEKFLSHEQKILWNMFIYTIWGKSPIKCGFQTYQDAMNQLLANREIFAELKEVIQFLLDENITISKEYNFPYPCPLELHCCYSLDQIIAAFEYQTFDKDISPQQGVIDLKEKKTQLLFITLNKRVKDYTPTTVYKDYSISEELFHWQTQTNTDDASDKGLSYINAMENNYQILLFVRKYKQKEDGITPPYYFLGDATYQSHEGSRPMNIIWKLTTPIPAFLLQQTNKFTIS